HFLATSYTLFFFFTATPTTQIYTLSLHDALPISEQEERRRNYRERFSTRSIQRQIARRVTYLSGKSADVEVTGSFVQLDEGEPRSEEHTSELQSQSNLVCRLLLEKKKKKK